MACRCGADEVPDYEAMLLDRLVELIAKHDTDHRFTTEKLEKIMADLTALNTALGQLDQVISTFAGLVSSQQTTIANLTAANASGDQAGVDEATAALQTHLTSALATLASFQNVATTAASASAAAAVPDAPVVATSTPDPAVVTVDASTPVAAAPVVSGDPGVVVATPVTDVPAQPPVVLDPTVDPTVSA